MKAFRQGEPIILKEGSSSAEQLARLEELRGTLSRDAEGQLEADIRSLRAGIAGERKILYELRNSHIDMVVLQDVHFEHNGLSAQVDFMVLTRQRYFIIECKNLYGNITVNERGEFIRQLGGGRREGLYSPVSQNRRHLELIRSMRLDGRGMLQSLVIDKSFDDQFRSLVVLANPKTIVDIRRAPADVRRAIVRADQLIERIKAINAERGLGHDRTSLANIQKAAEWYLEHDRGSGGASFTDRYHAETRADDASQPPNAVTASPPDRKPSPAAGPTKEADSSSQHVVRCPRCGATMILRTARRGAHAGEQFYGCERYPSCRGMVTLR